MPKRVITGTTYTAGRALSLGGTAYAVGATIPNAVLRTVRKLDTLISRRFVIPSAEPYRARKQVGRQKKPRPTHYNPQERRTL